MTTHRDTLLDAASAALRGQVADVVVRRSGSAALINAAKDAQWTGYSPQAELLKGLIVRTDPAGETAIELVAGCLPKFYNLNERAENDAAFLVALGEPGARLVFSAKQDGTNVRPFVHSDTGQVGFATRGMLDSSAVPGLAFIDFSAESRRIAARYYPALLDPGVVGRYTVVCELIHPDNQIVTNYGDTEDLLVLTVIDLASGEELTRAAVEAFCADHGLTATQRYAPAASDLDAAIDELRGSWAGTDLEGAVIAVERPGHAVPFRVKVKGERYLALFRMRNFCTLRRTRELAEEYGATSWDVFRARLTADMPELPEEVQMGYAAHFATYRAWAERVEATVESVIDAYLALPERDTPDQKAFALSIAQHPERSAFFTLRKLGTDAGRAAVAEAIGRRMEPELGDEVEDEEALAA